MKHLIKVIVALNLAAQPLWAGPKNSRDQQVDQLLAQLQVNDIAENMDSLARKELSKSDYFVFKKQKSAISQYSKIFSKMQAVKGNQSLTLKVEGVKPVEISWAREDEGLLLINQQPVNFANQSYKALVDQIVQILESKKSLLHLFVEEAHAGAYAVLAVAAVAALVGITLYSKSGKRGLTNLDEKLTEVKNACEKRDPEVRYSESETAKLFDELITEKNKELFFQSKKSGSDCVVNLNNGGRLAHPELVKSVCINLGQTLQCVRKYQQESVAEHGASSVPQQQSSSAAQ